MIALASPVAAWKLAGVAMLLVAAGAAGWGAGVRWTQAELQRERAERAGDQAAWATASAEATEAARAEDQRRIAALQGMLNHARSDAAAARRDAAAADAERPGLLNAAAAAARACGGADDPAASDGSQTAAAAGHVLADVLGRADARAAELAAALDAARAAGSLCERAYDALSTSMETTR